MDTFKKVWEEMCIQSTRNAHIQGIAFAVSNLKPSLDYKELSFKSQVINKIMTTVNTGISLISDTTSRLTLKTYQNDMCALSLQLYIGEQNLMREIMKIITISSNQSMLDYSVQFSIIPHNLLTEIITIGPHLQTQIFEHNDTNALNAIRYMYTLIALDKLSGDTKYVNDERVQQINQLIQTISKSHETGLEGVGQIFKLLWEYEKASSSEEPDDAIYIIKYKIKWIMRYITEILTSIIDRISGNQLKKLPIIVDTDDQLLVKFMVIHRKDVYPIQIINGKLDFPLESFNPTSESFTMKDFHLEVIDNLTESDDMYIDEKTDAIYVLCCVVSNTVTKCGFIKSDYYATFMGAMEGGSYRDKWTRTRRIIRMRNKTKMHVYINRSGQTAILQNGKPRIFIQANH